MLKVYLFMTLFPYIEPHSYPLKGGVMYNIYSRSSALGGYYVIFHIPLLSLCGILWGSMVVLQQTQRTQAGCAGTPHRPGGVWPSTVHENNDLASSASIAQHRASYLANRE